MSPPTEVSEAVKETFAQACFLVEVSPKASGALARDCLQKIVYEFWNIAPRNKGTLSSELDHISSILPEETKLSIGFVRNFGSIDTQMSEDVNMMVETTTEEAKMLVALIQTLFQDWYLERRSRERRYEILRKAGQKLSKEAPLELTKEAPLELTKEATRQKEATPQVECTILEKKANSTTRANTKAAAGRSRNTSIGNKQIGLATKKKG